MKKINIENNEFEIIKSYEDIIKSIKKLAIFLNAEFKDKKNIIWMTIMKGGVMFSTELSKYINFDIELDFITSSSYSEYKKINEPLRVYGGDTNFQNKHIILVDDIIDSGESMLKIEKFLKEFNPKSLTAVAMFGKKGRLKGSYKEFFSFSEEEVGFLVGFGLDINNKYRNLPFLATKIEK